MDFVVQVLQTYLQMDKKLATRTMLEVHQKGRVRLLSTTWGNVKELQANIDRESKKRGHPLVCSAVRMD